MSERESAVEEVLAHASSLEEQIRALQKIIESYNDALLNIKLAKQINDILGREHSENIVFSGDKRANLLLRASLVKGKPLVHVGLNLYVEADHETVSRILETKEKILTGQLERIRREYEDKVKEYKKLQELLYRISQQAE